MCDLTERFHPLISNGFQR